MKYTVTGTVAEFGVGQRLRLSAAQIDARRFALEDINEKSGEVTIKSLVQFKRGEEIDLKEKEDSLPRSLSVVLTPSSKLAAADKPKKASTSKAVGDEADLDAIEHRLEQAEQAFKAALERHGISIAKEPTAEQQVLIQTELDELQAAKRAYDEAIGED